MFLDDWQHLANDWPFAVISNFISCDFNVSKGYQWLLGFRPSAVLAALPAVAPAVPPALCCFVLSMGWGLRTRC
jgi:hypothetical protein